MNQAQFYIYDAERGWKDTINVRSGRMRYEVSLKDTTTLMLMFPNYSIIPIFAQPGAKVEMEGDASHLRETTVMGTEDNEDMTEFRLKANELTPSQIPQEARRFIIEHLSSPVSLYLLQRYFVYTTAPEYDEAYRLCQHIIDEGGGSGAAIRLSKQIAVMKNNAIGKQLPAFSAKDTNGKTVSNRQLKADVNVVCLWALWNRTSLSQLRTLRTLRKEHQERVSVVSICIDADQADAKHFLERDSIDWPNVCDGEMWQTTVAQKLNLTTMPANVITDKKGKIVARNITSAQQLKEKIEELLKDQKDK